MYDLILKNGTVIDGTGKNSYRADVAVENGRIAAVALNMDSGLAGEIADIRGFCVTPGFIDMHSHSDLAFTADDRCEAKIYQGVTSEVCGNCGFSPFPLPEKLHAAASLGDFGGNDPVWLSSSLENFVRKIEDQHTKMGTNILPLTGHGSLRIGVMGYEDRKPTEEELVLMKKRLTADMETGAWGMSLGLGYTPGISAEVEELSVLSEPVAAKEGLIASHMRNQKAGTPESLEEMFTIARHSGVHVHISHFKACIDGGLGQAPEWTAILHRACAEGIEATADVYPYTAANADITGCFPKWSLKGGKQRALSALKNEEQALLMGELEEKFADAGSAERIVFVHTCGIYPELDGKSLVDAAALWNMSYAEALAKMTLDTGAEAQCINFAMDEKDVEYMLRQNDYVIGSDGIAYPLNRKLNSGIPHPRNFGTFPRFLRLCREKNICSPEMAVHRITGLTATYLGLKDRGLIRKGMVADLAVVDMEHITDYATYTDPFQKSEGIIHVIMNGEFAVRDGQQTEKRLGRVLLK